VEVLTLHVVSTEKDVTMKRAFSVVKSNHPTLGIDAVTMNRTASAGGSVYNLKGQKLSAPQKGLNVQKGRKFIKK
jgi:hypothetical protein